MAGYSTPLHHTTILQAELLGLYHGLRIALNNHYKPLIAETDSQVLTTLLSTNNPKYSYLFDACMLLLLDLGSHIVQHTFREGIRVVDVLSSFGKDNTMAHPQ